jgi:hypothetical protein
MSIVYEWVPKNILFAAGVRNDVGVERTILCWFYDLGEKNNNTCMPSWDF